MRGQAFPQAITTKSEVKVRMDSTTVPEDFVRIFLCRSCSDYIQPPMLQCPNGHLLCSNCRHKLCTKCWAPLGNIRNLAMEQLASTLVFPCDYSTSGCAVSLRYTERLKHEDTCEFLSYSCPYPYDRCKWEGFLEEVVPHLMKSHEYITRLEDEDGEITLPDFNWSEEMKWCCVISRFNHHFLVTLALETCVRYRYFSDAVQLIGSRNQAQNFEYRLEINDQGELVTWEGITRSIRGATILHTERLSHKGKLSVDLSISETDLLRS